MIGRLLKKLKVRLCYREKMVEELRKNGFKIIDAWGPCGSFHIVYENARGERYLSSCTAKGAILSCITKKIWLEQA